MQNNPIPRWIWINAAETDRNSWQCFRKEIFLETDCPPEQLDAELTITADSRYVLSVNGHRLGTGPMRYFQEKIPYDRYAIAPYLTTGKNVIGILVQHYGAGTMQYRAGNPGLWTDGFVKVPGQTISLASGESFLTAPCPAFDSRSPRIAVQQAFTEHFDARRWEDFSSPDYLPDECWTQAVPAERVTGEQYLRDIPKLTQELFWPKRVSRLRRVAPPSCSYVVDTRSMLLPAGEDKKCNPAFVQGILTTSLRLEKAAKVTFYFDISRCYPVFIGNRWYQREDLQGREHLYLETELEAGAHLIAFDLMAREHWMGVHFALDCDTDFCWEQPAGALSPDAETPFLLLGPLAPAVVMVDDTPMPEQDLSVHDAAVSQLEKHGIAGLEQYQQPVPLRLVSECDPFLLFANVRENDNNLYTELAVPQQLHNMILAGEDWAELPLFAGYDTEVTVDFGCETVGYLRFVVDAPAGTILDFYPYEYVRQKKIQHTWGMDPVLRYVCRGGKQEFVSFLRRGFRYCSVAVRGASGAVKFQEISVLQSAYPLPQIGRFSCSDRLLTDIWEISAHTVRMCSEDTFVDCPAYEQVFWVGDSRNESLISQYVYGNTDNIRRCLELVPLSAPQSPLLCDQVPSDWDSVIPNWSFAWVIACGEQYQYTGDITFAKSIYPAVRNCMEAFLSHCNQDGLLEIEAWNLLDWAPADQPNAGVVTHQNMFMVKALRETAHLAEVSGTDSSEWLNRADTMQTAIERRLWSEKKQAYFDCIHPDGSYSEIFSIQTQICALLCDIPLAAERKKRLEELVTAPPEAFVQVCSPFMAFFLYEVLEKLGHTALLLDDMRCHFGTMVRYGATTCWEQYPESPLNKVVEGMLSRSHCHAWSAAPAYFLSRSILGIRPVTPGWTEVEIAPQPSGIAWAEGTVPHPSGGEIEVSYQITGKHMEIYISAPEYVKVTVRMPAGIEGNPRIVYTKKVN